MEENSGLVIFDLDKDLFEFRETPIGKVPLFFSNEKEVEKYLNKEGISRYSIWYFGWSGDGHLVRCSENDNGVMNHGNCNVN